ncbi:MAG: outer membrane protein assembly factor BamD [Candidatus Omnitrophica bacterium]|nr:outer membrane protein assembly factor BamD [Candidatus Omnitrophota bacterium]
MRRRILPLLLLFVQLTCLGTEAHAYWVWTPKTGRWINPKTQPKDSPQDQLEYANSFYERKDPKRAVKEYLRLVRHYPKSAQAPEAQFYLGQCYEGMNQPYQAFQAYKKLVEIYPYSARFKDAIARSFAIGEALYEGEKVRPIQPVPVAFPALDKAVEIFEHIVLQAPYGEFGDKAQFRLGQSLRKLGQYGEALKAFEKVIQEYKQSPLVEDARYNLAFCAKQMSLKPGYDQESTDQAIAWFEEFIQNHRGSELLPEAERSLAQLRTYKAEGIYKVADFYRRQKKWISAELYYRRIISEYSDTPVAGEAVSRLTEMEQAGRVPAQS